MASITAARCPGCGYENNPQYKFCGMCGTALHPENRPAANPRVATPRPASPPKAAPLTVGSYSILGLAAESADVQPPPAGVPPRSERQEQKPRVEPARVGRQDIGAEDSLLNRNLDYLFEDDEKKQAPRWRMYAALVLLAIAAGTLVWQWQRNGYPWDDLRPLSNSYVAPSAPAASPKPSPTVTSPQPESSNSTEALRPSKAPAETAPIAPKAAPQNTRFLKPVASSEGDSDAAAVVPEGASHSDAVPEKVPSAAANLPAPENNPQQTAPPSTDSPAVASSAANPQVDASRLLQEGTQYLLGNGVEQNCDRAQKDLRAAARFSSDAQSMLGTMYASGHCVSRDLPTAYHWYAKALHSQPANSRIQSDLTALWNQMTPAEKQLAARGEQ